VVAIGVGRDRAAAVDGEQAGAAMGAAASTCCM
jgi:hypothetical protein